MFWKALTNLLGIFQTHFERRLKVFMNPKKEMMKKVTLYANGPCAIYRHVKQQRQTQKDPITASCL